MLLMHVLIFGLLKQEMQNTTVSSEQIEVLKIRNV